MLKSRFLTFAGTFAIISTLIFITCVLPEDPADPSNATLTPLFKNTQGTIFETTAVDTTGKKLSIGVAVHLPENFDSVKLVIISDNARVDSITFTRFLKELTDDTLWFSQTFLTPGLKNIQVTPYSTKVSLLPFTASILIVNSTTITPQVNHAPVLSHTGNTMIKPGEACQLTLVSSDEDSGQIVVVTFAEPFEGATIADNIFSWTAPATFAGVKTVKLLATDNGTPPKSTPYEIAITVTATPLLQVYTVTYNANTGTGTAPADSSHYEEGASVTVAAVGSLTKTDSEFAGWNTSADGKGTARAPGTAFDMGDADVTLYAQWTPNVAKPTYVLTVSATNGSVTKAPDLSQYDSGTVVTLTPVPAANYHFAGWSGALSGTTNPATVTMNSATLVTAEFAKNQANSFALTVLATNGTVKKSPELPQYDSGSTVGLKATPAAGYSFVNWSGDVAGTTDSVTVTMSTAKSVTANFAPITYQLTVSADTGGRITVPAETFPKTVNQGDATTITAAPDAGYKFNGWAVTSGTATFDDTSSASTSVTLTSGNATVSARFTRITYQLTLNTETGGTITAPASPATVNYGTSITITATPKPGYSFNGWLILSGSAAIPDLLSATTTATLTSGNAEVKAQWTAIPYSIAYTLNGGQQAGGIYPATYSVNTAAITLPSPTKTAYVFDGWYENSGQSGNKVTSIPAGSTGDKTLFAKWAIQDIDGNYYTEVKIGNQYWMVENFRCTKYNDGTGIEHVEDDARWAGLSTGAYCFYENSTDNTFRQKYGALYNGYAVATGKMAPEGWRVPTDEDWMTLQDYLIANGYNYDGTSDSNKIAKSLAAKSDWISSTNIGAIGNGLSQNNRSGFSALPSGRRNGSFEYFGIMLQFCQSEVGALESGVSRTLHNTSSEVAVMWYGPGTGCSVRLVHD